MAADILLKLEGPDLKGESQDASLKDQIEVLSWQWGVSQPGNAHSGSGVVVGRAAVSDLSISKLVDKSSPQLMLKCALGQTFNKAILSVRKAVGEKKSQQPFVIITLETVLIAGYAISGSDGAGTPTESVTLNFAKITYDYKVQDSKGTLTSAGAVTYDANKAESA
ncbi:MAG TPA: type VI secretion system tube protein Hcp [Candidatus Acidoferrales bacterium]|nr:type VI secretion system tube protein Hcp [Candidatus Acidoferrales bacterium]